MPKRFYISKIIGDGSYENPYRPEVSDDVDSEVDAAGSWVIPTGANGVPIFPWALCVVGALNHLPMQSRQDTDPLPDITMDSTLSVLTNQERNRLLQFMTKRGIDTSGINVNSTFREVIDRIGKALDVNFNALQYDVNW